MATAAPLTLAEELILVALDDSTGKLYQPADLSSGPLNVALAGALLMELALEGRIDTDSEKLFVVSPKPVGSAMLDEVLAEIVAHPTQEHTEWWLMQLSGRAGDYQSRLIAMLVGRGILREHESRLLWVFKLRTYPPTTGREEREVKSRITALLYNDEIPDPRDSLLVALLHATTLFSAMFAESELESLRPRIEQIIKFEQIGRALLPTIGNLQAQIALAARPYY